MMSPYEFQYMVSREHDQRTKTWQRSLQESDRAFAAQGAGAEGFGERLRMKLETFKARRHVVGSSKVSQQRLPRIAKAR